MSGQPGKGGVNKGPGSAPMIWGSESSSNKSKFKTKKVDGKVVNPEGSQLLEEERKRAMNLEPGKASNPRGGKSSTGENLGSNRTQISPKYRKAIKKYFNQD